MSRNNDEKLSKHSAQVNTLHGELLRREGYQSPENLPYQDSATSIPKGEVSIADAQNVTDSNPKREVSVASSARSISPGTTQVILTAIQRMEQRISGLADRVDKSDERASSSRPHGESARGRSITMRNPDDPDDDDDDSDDT